MQSRLNMEDGLLEEVDMDADAAFDTQLKGALENIEPTYTPEAWALMEAELDLEDNLAELEDTDLIDAMAYRHLNNLEVPYDENSWQPLAEKLDDEFSIRRRLLYRYKIVEVGLMLLFLFTMFNYLPVHKKVVNSIKNEIAKKDKPSNDSTNQLYADAAINQKDLNQNNSTNSSIDNRNAKTTNTNVDRQIAIINQSTEEILVESTTTIVQSTTSNYNPNPTVITEDYSTQQESTVTTFTKQSSDAALPPQENLIEVAVEEENEVSTKTARIADLSAIPTLKSRFLEEEVEDYPTCLLCKPNKTPLRIKAAMFLVGDYNYIMTPYDRDFDLRAYNHASKGYGVGFTLGFALGNWEVETGGVYASKNYSPKSVPELLGDFQNGYIENRLKEIQLDIIQVPLNIRYSFDKLSKWNIYAMAGTSLNVASSANYYFETTYASRPEPGGSAQTIIEEESTYNNKIFSNGWFEGGSFLENRYFTANLGLGAERQLNHRWSVFMQNSYQHTLPTGSLGLGPNRDRLNTLSIFAGARATLK